MMGRQRKKTRVTSSVDRLPEAVRQNVDAMLADTSNTYLEISIWLMEQGFEVSKSSIGRYALRSSSAAQRLLEAQMQTEKLVKIIQNKPDEDYTEAAMRMMMDGLVNKLAAAEEEFDEMPLDKAGRLIASLSRTKVYKDRVRQDMAKKAELAFRELESDLMQAVAADEEDAKVISNILSKAQARMMEDD